MSTSTKSGFLELPVETHRGDLSRAGINIPCSNLSNGRRVLTTSGLQALTGTINVGSSETTVNERNFGLPSNIIPFAPKELDTIVQPIEFLRERNGTGKIVVVGYDAMILPLVCGAYMLALASGKLRASQIPAAHRAIAISVEMSTVGVAALIDEATGFQEVRPVHALADMVAKIRQAWELTFDDPYYLMIERLFGAKKSHRRCGQITKDIVYSRIVPGLIDYLEELNPILPGTKNQRAWRHHEFLTKVLGHPVLKGHLSYLEGLGSNCPDASYFMKKLDAERPKHDHGQRLLPMEGGQFGTTD